MVPATARVPVSAVGARRISDSLHLFRRDLLDGKPGRHAFAVDEELREAAAHAAHLHRPAAPRDARLA